VARWELCYAVSVCAVSVQAGFFASRCSLCWHRQHTSALPLTPRPALFCGHHNYVMWLSHTHACRCEPSPFPGWLQLA
jgi:hypothetical protein